MLHKLGTTVSDESFANTGVPTGKLVRQYFLVDSQSCVCIPVPDLSRQEGLLFFSQEKCMGFVEIIAVSLQFSFCETL